MSARRTTILIAAMGGEGGGVLSQWICDVLEGAGFRLQYTAIPGVAQRTGATTYYIECLAEAAVTGADPVFSLLPMPGKVDIAIATELAEVGRMIEKGYVTPGRTLLIGSTHRVFAMSEKMAMADGRMAAGPVLAAASARSRDRCLGDFSRLAAQSGAIINAPVLGAFARLNPFGIAREAFEDVLKAGGRSAAVNLAGFARGWSLAAGDSADDASPPIPPPPAASGDEAGSLAGFPPDTHATLVLCVKRLTGYQSSEYADIFLQRLQPFAGAPVPLIEEIARQLTLWMAYNDVARVAQLKLDPERIERIAAEAGLKAGDRAEIIDYFKPGAEEFAAMLPQGLARLVRRWGGRRALALHLNTSSITGQLILRAIAGLRRHRPGSDRYLHEQANITRWLAHLAAALRTDPDAAFEIADCARLLKGYGETWSRGALSFDRIARALPTVLASPQPARVIAALRTAALADPEGKALDGAFKTFELTEARP